MNEFKGIAQLFEKHGWPPVRTITAVLGGNVNPAYDINSKWIVRLNRRDPHLRKFHRESLAMGYLKDRVPVPAVLGLDESRSILDSDVLVTEKLPGESITSYWKTLTAKQQHELAFHAGEMLAQIHTIEIEKPGPLEAPLNRTWTETLALELERHWREAVDRGLFSAELDAELWRIFRVLRSEFEEVKSLRLLHGDFHFGNILGQGTNLTGIVDFEWSRAGDPDMDFCNASNFQESAAGSEVLLTEGYRSRRPEFQPNSRKVKFYALLAMLELSCVSAKHWLGQVDQMFAELKHQT
jgi:aminoglycoside phosphotransferase (APT) family kinase protein